MFWQRRFTRRVRTTNVSREVRCGRTPCDRGLLFVAWFRIVGRRGTWELPWLGYSWPAPACFQSVAWITMCTMYSLNIAQANLANLTILTSRPHIARDNSRRRSARAFFLGRSTLHDNPARHCHMSSLQPDLGRMNSVTTQKPPERKDRLTAIPL